MPLCRPLECSGENANRRRLCAECWRERSQHLARQRARYACGGAHWRVAIAVTSQAEVLAAVTRVVGNARAIAAQEAGSEGRQARAITVGVATPRSGVRPARRCSDVAGEVT